MVLGKTVDVDVAVRNNGNTPTAGYNLAFYFTDDEGATRIAAATSGAASGPYEGVGAGDPDSLSLTVEVPGTGTLSVGAYDLCAQIQATDSDSNSTEVGNSKCDLVFALPDMGDEFPEPILPVDFESAPDPNWSISNCVPKDFGTFVDEDLIPNLPATIFPELRIALAVPKVAEKISTPEHEVPTEEEIYWIFTPTAYTTETAATEINDGIFTPIDIGALETYRKRVQIYRKLALEIAIKKGRSDEVFSIGLQDGAEKALDVAEFSQTAYAAANAYGQIVSGKGLLESHLQALVAEGLFDGLEIGAPLLDALFSAAVNRTIELEQAAETLVLLKDLPMDSAWAAGVACAGEDVLRMAHGSLLDNWADEVRRNQDELVAAVAKIVAKKILVKGIAVGTKIVLGKAVVVTGPISLTVGLAVLTVAEIITETVDYWGHLGLATISAQTIAHLYDLPYSSTLKRETMDYAVFAFYQHMYEAARPTIAPVLRQGDNKPQDHDITITNRRDLALEKIIDTAWSPANDIDKLVSYPGGSPPDPSVTGKLSAGGLWIDGETMWIAGDKELFAYDFPDGTINGDKGFKLDSNHTKPRGAWADSATQTMWVAEAGGQFQDILAYGLPDGTRDRRFNEILPSDIRLDLENDSPTGMWSDGTTIWVADETCVTNELNFCLSENYTVIYAYRLNDGKRDREAEFHTLASAGNDSPQGIWSDGKTLWVADADDGRVYAYDMASKIRDPGRDVDTVTIPGIVDNRPLAGIWSDGETMWVLDPSAGEEKLFAYDMIGKPRNLEAELAARSNTQQIELDWDRPRSDGGSRITGYIVQVAEDGEPWTALVADTESTATEYTHADPGGGTKYRYRVAAISGERLGFWSDTAAKTTLEAPYISSLRCWPRTVIVGQTVTCNPGVTGGFSADYTYSWIANTGVRGNPWEGDEKEFTTQWSWPGNPGVNLMVCDSISRCTGGRQDIRVVSNTAPDIEIISPDDFFRVEAGQPQTFIFAANDPDKNFQSWYWFVDGDRKGGEDPIYAEDLHSYYYQSRILKSFEYTFPGGDSYEVEVRFTDGEGATGSAKWEVYASSPSLPQAPTITDIIMTGDGSSFSVLWKPPASTGGRTPTSYDLRYAEYADNSSPTWTTVTGAWRTGFPLRATVRDLSGGDTAYDVQVRAVYGGTTGSWSSTFIAAPQSEVLVTDFASQFALPGFAPTDTTLDVRLLPGETSSELPRLEITIFDEDGMSNRAETESDSDSENSVLGPGSVTVAVPKETWVAYGESTLEIYMNGRWVTYSPAVERTLVASEAFGLGLTGFITGRSLMPGLFGISRSLGAFRDWQAAGGAEPDIDEVFGEDYLNCFQQVSRSWRVPVGLPGALLNALTGDFGLTKGVRVIIPISLSDDDYVSLAASFIASETGEGESSLVYVPDLLGASGIILSCQPPAAETE